MPEAIIVGAGGGAMSVLPDPQPESSHFVSAEFWTPSCPAGALEALRDCSREVSNARNRIAGARIARRVAYV